MAVRDRYRAAQSFDELCSMAYQDEMFAVNALGVAKEETGYYVEIAREIALEKGWVMKEKET